jgi:hypothetical protein
MKVINSIFNVLRFNQRNWRAVVLCIFAATVFWFFNALNKTYTTNLRFPLSFDYDHENFVPVKALPRDVRINGQRVGAFQKKHRSKNSTARDSRGTPT